MKVIIGKINSSNTIGYWDVGNGYTPDVIVGDYAIVETKDKYGKFLAPNGISKSAVRYLARCQVRKD